MHNMKSFTMDRPQFEALKIKLRTQLHIEIDADEGEIAAMGIRLKYHFGENTQLLTMKILSRPQALEPSVIWGYVRQWIG